MYKLILVVLAIIAVASAQLVVSPYYSGYRYGYAGYPVAYGGYSGYTPYAYSYLYK